MTSASREQTSSDEEDVLKKELKKHRHQIKEVLSSFELFGTLLKLSGTLRD